MKRIALVAPGRNKSWGLCEPLNLAYLASYLTAHGFEAIVIDEIAGQDVEAEIERFRPDIVGITATTPIAPDAYRVAGLCRKKGIRTVMGGVHATVMPEEAIKHVDIVVKGEGERALLDIAQGRITSGIVSGSHIEDIDGIPAPARRLVRQEFYLYTKKRLGDIVSHLLFAPEGARTANLLTSRGCPYACTFCHNNWKGTPVRFHSPKRVIQEIKTLIDDYRIEAFFIIDDNFCAKKSRLKEICRLMEEEGIRVPWACNATANNIDGEVAGALKRAGCAQVMFGFESGSQRMLDVLGKRTKVEKNAQAAKVCKEAGLLVTASFMIGSPTETVADIRMTQEFIRQHSAFLDMVGVNITTPYPGTAIWNDLKKRGLTPETPDWGEFFQLELPVRVCYEIEPEELKRLHLETASIKPMRLSRIWNRAMLDPVQAVSVFLRSPVASFKILVNSVRN